MLNEKQVRALLVCRLEALCKTCNSYHMNQVGGQIRALLSVLNDGKSPPTFDNAFEVLNYADIPHTNNGDGTFAWDDEWLIDHGFKITKGDTPRPKLNPPQDILVVVVAPIMGSEYSRRNREVLMADLVMWSWFRLDCPGLVVPPGMYYRPLEGGYYQICEPHEKGAIRSKTMGPEMEGVLVSEVEVSKDLGFDSVHEMRRWQTEMGQKVANVEEKLRTASNDRDHFRWHLRQMNLVLEKIAESGVVVDPDLALAIQVVMGKGVDWDNRINGWFDDLKTGE